MNIIFDTETTGLLKAPNAPLRVQPKIIELSAISFSSEDPDIIIEELDLLIDPGEPLTDEIVGITGITQEMVNGKGSFAAHLSRIQNFWLGSKASIAHNITFDIDMLDLELRRLGATKKFPWSPRQIDTVEETVQFQSKRLKLSDLHAFLFGESFADAHRAMNDVKATHRCLVELVRRNIVQLPK